MSAACGCLPDDSVSPVLALSSLPKAMVSPPVAWPRFSKCCPMSLNTPETRPASPAGVMNVVPSPAWPASMRAIDILPPCVVWNVLSTSATASLAGLDAEPSRRFVDARRLMPQRLEQPQHAIAAGGDADQHRTDQAVAQFLGEIVEHLVARRLDVLKQLLHQLVVVIGERLQHREARFFLAIEIVALERRRSPRPRVPCRQRRARARDRRNRR